MNKKYYELKFYIDNIKNNLGWIKNYSKIDNMFLFFYDYDDINLLFKNLINIEINQVLYPLGYNNLYYAINHHIKILYNLIFKFALFNINDLLDDNKIIQINNIIDDYKIDYNNIELQQYYKGIKSKLLNENISHDNYIKSYIKENILYIRDRYMKKLSNFIYNNEIKQIIRSNNDIKTKILLLNKELKYATGTFGDNTITIYKLKNIIATKLHFFNNLKIDFNNINDLLNNDDINILYIIILKYYNKLLDIKDKLLYRQEYISNNPDILKNMKIIIKDVYNIINKTNIDKYEIINDLNLKIYLNKKYYYKYLDKGYNKNNILKILDDINITKNFELDDIKKIYENKNLINHNELSDNEILDYITIIYDNELFRDIFDYISKQINKKLNKNILKDEIDNICKYMLFTIKDLSNNNSSKMSTISCDKLNDELYLELIHPKYFFDKYKYDKLLPHQKQGIFGFTDDTYDYIDCHDYFFNTFLYKDNNLLKIDKLYSMQLNKLILYCMSKRDNIFCIRYVNKGLLPLHKINNDQFFFNTINEINKNDLYLGIIEKTINKLHNKEHYGNKIYYYIIYNGHYNEIFLYDHNMNCTSNYYLMDPIVVTFMEIQQLCFYLNLYCYSYNKNQNYIFFSKYNIFNDNEIYDKSIYEPLNINEFNQVLQYYRSNMKLLKCFKYPGLDIDIPRCISNKYHDKLNNEIIRSNLDINDIYNETQLYFYHKDDCSLTNHSFIK